MNYLLDTNVVLIYAKGSSMADLLKQDIQLFNGNNNLFISVVTVGEVESLMMSSAGFLEM